jgi:succinate-semialdehyde dehydrogenase/glutarate-semialdehyde dehydrogenase
MTQQYDQLYLFIDGEWLSASTRSTLPVVDPATEAVIGHLPIASPADLSRALDAAGRSFAEWRSISAYARSSILRTGAALLRERTEAIAVQMTLEEGKPIAEARRELGASADVLEWFAEEGRRAYGRIIPARDTTTRFMVVQEPVGPAVAFAPWNFPAMTPLRKVAASLAAGCSCILKPSEETPATALAIARALDDAGLPKGVLQVVFGEPAQISSTFLASPIIRKMSFTGSTAVGKQLCRLAADNLIRTTMELGGHAPVVVFDDADLEQLIPAAITTKFRNAGQVCTSPTRFYVHSKLYGEFVERFSSAAAALRLGSGLIPETQMGPLANARRLAAMNEAVQGAIKDGASLVAGGERFGNRGYFWRPTVLADVPQHARVMREEPFGPIALIHAFNELDEVVSKANATPFGLAAYAYTASGRKAAAISAALESGMVGINTFNITVPESPFGGVKDSGHGSEGGSEGLASYLATKFINQA